MSEVDRVIRKSKERKQLAGKRDDKSKDQEDESDQALTMKTAIEHALDLEEIGVNIYRSKILWIPPGARGVFGGHIMGQSLMAANQTVEGEYNLHSFHSYFILPARADLQILYEIRPLRDGNNFCTRLVVARQRGKAIYTCVMSYHKKELGGVEHQTDMPQVPPPEECPSQREEYIQFLKENTDHISDALRESIMTRIDEPFPVEFRNVVPRIKKIKDITHPEARPPRLQLWFKANGTLPDKLSLHQCAAAYASDHSLLSTSLLPHQIGFFNPHLKLLATLDHSMWFHAPFRADEWLLHDMESPRASGQRGMAFSRIYTRDGKLVMSCAQEGVIRVNLKDKSIKPAYSLGNSKKGVLPSKL